jgi:hypothetical protein
VTNYSTPRDHAAIDLVHPWTGQVLPIDIAIADLIQAVWRRGWRTWASCQDVDDTRTAQIVFEHRDQALEFVHSVTGGEHPEGWTFTFWEVPITHHYVARPIGVYFDRSLIGTAIHALTRTPCAAAQSSATAHQ